MPVVMGGASIPATRSLAPTYSRVLPPPPGGAAEGCFVAHPQGTPHPLCIAALHGDARKPTLSLRARIGCQKPFGSSALGSGLVSARLHSVDVAEIADFSTGHRNRVPLRHSFAAILDIHRAAEEHPHD